MNVILSCFLLIPFQELGVENALDQPPTMKMVFEEELRVTSLEDERLFFGGRFLDLDVDDHGSIYVVYGTENKVLVIDANGEFVTALGGAGKGPGEFEHLRGFKILDSGQAIAMESGNNICSLSYYDENMRFLTRKSKQTPFTFFDWNVTNDGANLAGMMVTFGQAVEGTRYAVLTSEFEEKFHFHAYEIENFQNFQFDDPEFWLKFIPSRLGVTAKGEIPFFAFDNQGNLFTAIGKAYEITKWSPKGEKLAIIKKAYKPLFQSEEEIEALVSPLKESLQSQVPVLREMFTDTFLKRAVDKSGFTNASHPIKGLLVTDSNHLIVVHEHSFLTRKAKGHVFDSAGKFLGHCEMPNNGFRYMTFHKGKAYSLSQDENEEWYVVRFRYRLEPI